MTGLLHIPNTGFSPFPERAIHRYEDWRAFASKPAAIKPAMPSVAEYNSMSNAERKAFNQARAYYHNSFGPIFVPAMEKIHTAALRLASQNLRAPPGARPGIIMDGISTVGKTTIAMHLGRRYERSMTNDFKITTAPSGQTFIPVAFINLPGEMNIMNFNILLADFYGIPYSKSRVKEHILTGLIKEYAADCATSMFILDDIHFLQIKNRKHETLNNHIKHMANSISATFIYAGINLEGTGLLTEGRSATTAKFSQTGHRFKKFDLAPYRYDNEDSKKVFSAVLSAFESHLLLFKQVPGSLVQICGEYIHVRTGGYLGPISTMLREAAAVAIKSKSECITIDILKKIKLDSDSEGGFEAYRRRMKASTQRAAT